jgi:hypothetical protein
VDTTVLAALIGAMGTIAAAVITATLQARESQSSAPPRHGFRKVLVLIGVLSAVVGLAIKVSLYDWTDHRIRAALATKSGYRQVVYDKVGMGFLLPDQWTIDDASFRFGGGDIDLIRDYDPQFNSISQGIRLRFLSVQKNYVNSPVDEFGNEEETLKDIDPQVRMIDVTLDGRPAKRFLYKQKAGERFNYIERTWVRLTPRVKLEVIAVSNLDDKARQVFNTERDRIIESLVIDTKKISALSAAT